MDPMTMAMMAQGAGSLLGNLFTDPGQPYQAAMNQFQNWNQKAANVQNPFLQAGQGAIGNYQNWLHTMQNPAAFQNQLMNQYQESPYAKFQQQQAMRSAQNAGSASGMLGSSPLTMQEQQNASNISAGDMNNWMQNALGINTQYGQGQANMMGMGQNAANALTGLYGQEAQGMGEMAYGQGTAENQRTGNIFSDIF